MNLDAALSGDLGLWYYPLTILLVALDAPFPPLPSELLVLGAGPLAADGLLSPAGVVLAAAAGCWIGDVGLYLVFRHGLTSWFDRFAWGRRAHRGIVTLMNRMGRDGTYAGLVGVRFLSGGRTASVAAAGLAGVPLGPFLGLAGLGAVLWALWMVSLGYLTGSATGLPTWASALMGMALGTLVGVVLAAGLALRTRGKGIRGNG
ncbi:DedA family protein [Arthrobacter halodurans]|uniref:DedA family protein n=1 Tax=Arthrobacter halodurans TaxID=516699 RepID=A0ABV4UMW4_9MICC